MIIDNLIIFTAMLVVTGFILKAVVKYIDNQEKADSCKKHKFSHQ